MEAVGASREKALPNYLFCGGSCRLVSKQALLPFFFLAAHLFSPSHSEGQCATPQRFLLQQQFCWLPLQESKHTGEHTETQAAPALTRSLN